MCISSRCGFDALHYAIASMIAFNVALGRIAAAVFFGSGR
jgi:hypothetical protein